MSGLRLHGLQPDEDALGELRGALNLHRPSTRSDLHGVLLAVAVIVLVMAFLMASGEENLALVALILAVVVAVPLLVSGGLCWAGIAERTRSPKLASALLALRIVVGALDILFVGWLLLGSI